MKLRKSIVRWIMGISAILQEKIIRHDSGLFSYLLNNNWLKINFSMRNHWYHLYRNIDGTYHLICVKLQLWFLFPCGSIQCNWAKLVSVCVLIHYNWHCFDLYSFKNKVSILHCIYNSTKKKLNISYNIWNVIIIFEDSPWFMLLSSFSFLLFVVFLLLPIRKEAWGTINPTGIRKAIFLILLG